MSQDTVCSICGETYSNDEPVCPVCGTPNDNYLAGISDDNSQIPIQSQQNDQSNAVLQQIDVGDEYEVLDAQAIIRCPNCMMPNPMNAKVCSRCNYNLAGSDPSRVSSTPQYSKPQFSQSQPQASIPQSSMKTEKNQSNPQDTNLRLTQKALYINFIRQCTNCNIKVKQAHFDFCYKCGNKLPGVQIQQINKPYLIGTDIVLSIQEVIQNPNKEIMIGRNNFLITSKQDKRIIEFELLAKAVSRAHFSLMYKNNEMYITDYSTYGTFLNGEKMIPKQQYPLKPGDIIILSGQANLSLKYVI